ncbi:hypothetical protein Noda2021_12540 [Candidatus Dependentiae bacterium Noda2021]|nr:hypothetical protein Noda2021_12540 [Candidatus Dependentiae bacterium Noda2021]
MKWSRIWAMILRHAILLFKDANRIIWIFYWPLVDIALWGFTANWVNTNQTTASSAGLALITAVVFWQLVNRAGFEVSSSLLEEFWSLNMVNIFATPLKISEWIIASILLTVGTSIFVTLYCILAVKLMYGISIIGLGLSVVPYLLSLFIAGLWISFVSSIFLIYFGARVQSLAFMLTWLFAPFIAAFYPLEILPSYGRIIAYLLPMTYSFEGIRLLVTEGIFNASLFWWGFSMSLLYCALAIWGFKAAFERSKEKGLARLTAD